MAAMGFGTLDPPARRAIPQRPFLSGPAGFPQSGTRLTRDGSATALLAFQANRTVAHACAGTGLDGLLTVQPSIFIPENRPGRNPSLGGQMGAGEQRVRRVVLGSTSLGKEGAVFPVQDYQAVGNS